MWKRDFSSDLVLAEPEVLRVPLIEGHDQFVIIGTDGLWDAIGVAGAVSECSRWHEEHGTLDGVAEHLAREAVAAGIDDNVTLVVIGLPGLAGTAVVPGRAEQEEATEW